MLAKMIAFTENQTHWRDVKSNYTAYPCQLDFVYLQFRQSLCIWQYTHSKQGFYFNKLAVAGDKENHDQTLHFIR